MDESRLPFRAGLEEYQRQADALLDAWKSGDSEAIRLVHTRHPRFLDERIPWLPKKLTDRELRSAAFEPGDAQLVIARWYDFRDWAALAEYVAAVTEEGSAVWQFESAVEAAIHGDLTRLSDLLRGNPELVVRARRASRLTTRRCIVARCCTTWARTESKDTARKRRPTRWKSPGHYWKRAPSRTRWRVSMGESTRP